MNTHTGTRIVTHHCGDCGTEINPDTETCSEHPNTVVESIVSCSECPHEEPQVELHKRLFPAFIAEVRRLGGIERGSSDWLHEAIRIGLDASDDAVSLAWLCVDDELSQLDRDDPRAVELRAALEQAQEG